MIERNTVQTENVSGSTFATWETDGRGLTVGDIYLTTAEDAWEARITFTTSRMRDFADRVTRDGSIGGERLG